MGKIVDKIKQLYRLDKTGEGESNKLVVVLRTIELAMLLYFIICSFYFGAYGAYTVCCSFVLTGAVFIGLLLASYKHSIKMQIICVNTITLVAILAAFFMYGRNILVQNFFLALIVVVFFSGYGYYQIKSFYAIVVLVINILMQSYGRYVVPSIRLSDANSHFLQIMNIIFPFFCIAFVCYVYSSDSQHLEGKLIEYNNLLKKQASTDPLTGLCNRRSAMDMIEELARSKSENGFCVCMCDIDYFKKVNDTYGHDIGDKVLRGMAKTMLEGFPKNCLISRWGGEEFLVIFPNMNGDDAKMILDIMRTKIKKMVFEVGPEKSFSITVTYGLAEYGYSGSVDTLVKEADEKLYYGKEHGRDQVVF